MTTKERRDAYNYCINPNKNDNDIGRQIFKDLVNEELNTNSYYFEIAEDDLLESLETDETITEDDIIQEVLNNEYYYDRAAEQVIEELTEEFE